MPFRDVGFEKFYAYAKLLQTKLPKQDLSESLMLVDEVAMEYYRLQKIKDGSIDLVSGEYGELNGLSEADRLFFEQIEAELIDSATLQTQAKVNKIDTFKYAFEEMFVDKLIERMDQNQEIFKKILEDQSFGGLAKELMMKKVYAKLNEDA